MPAVQKKKVTNFAKQTIIEAFSNPDEKLLEAKLLKVNGYCLLNSFSARFNKP